MRDQDALVERLAEAGDAASAADLLGEHLLGLAPGGAVRVWVLGPGDRCRTCRHAKDCADRTRCLHLVASLGAFALPPGHVERIPRATPPWGPALASSEPCFGPVPGEAEGPGGGGGTALLVPLASRRTVVGVAALRTAPPPSEETRDAARAAALATAATLGHLLAEERLAQGERHLALLGSLGRRVGSILDDELLLRQATAAVRDTFGFHNVMVLVRAPDGQSLVLRAQATSEAVPGALGRTLPSTRGVVGRALREGRTVVVDDVQHDPDFVGWFPETRSEIAIPVAVSGHVEGVLNVESDRPQAFGTWERLVLETIASQIAIAIENARLFGLLEEREERYRTLLESNPGAVLHLDASGRVVFANPAARRLTGQQEQDEKVDLEALVAPEDRPALATAIADALRGTPRADLELHVRPRAGGTRWVQASFQALLDGAGKPCGVVVLARDRSREKELQERLLQAEKLGAIGGLVSGVAHELNNPLAGILGYVQLLLEQPVEEWTRGDVEKIEQNARRCQAIVASLLQFARQARLSKRTANLNDVIESVLRLNELQLRVDGIRVEKSYDPLVPATELDVNRWQQVVINLASNAQQAMVAAGSAERRLCFETKVEGDEIVLRVSDTGPGVPPTLRSRVFEPFFTTKEAGTGLGLSICYGIVHDHGGRIALDGEYAGGARFVIHLPAPRDVPSPGTVDAPRPPVREDGGRHREVLVLDDEPDVREVLRAWLERHGYVPTCFGEAALALEHAATHACDALLVDLALPGGMDGIAFYDRLAATRPDLAQKVVFVTGYAFHDGLSDDLEARGAPCLQKPFDLHELLRVVGEVAARPSAPP